MEFIYMRRAQYHETDKMGIIHHSNYIRWFEEARVALLEAWGMGYDKLEELDIVSPVLSVSCEYKSMVRFMDDVKIICAISAYDGLRLEFTYRVLDAGTDALRAEGVSRHCFLAADGHPVSLRRRYPALDETIKERLAPPDGR